MWLFHISLFESQYTDPGNSVGLLDTFTWGQSVVYPLQQTVKRMEWMEYVTYTAISKLTHSSICSLVRMSYISQFAYWYICHTFHYLLVSTHIMHSTYFLLLCMLHIQYIPCIPQFVEGGVFYSNHRVVHYCTETLTSFWSSDFWQRKGLVTRQK